MLIYSKYKEYHADKYAAEHIQDLEILRFARDLCLEFYMQYEKKHNLNPEERGTFKRFMYDELHTPDFLHPNPLLRSQIFEKSIKK